MSLREQRFEVLITHSCNNERKETTFTNQANNPEDAANLAVDEFTVQHPTEEILGVVVKEIF